MNELASMLLRILIFSLSRFNYFTYIERDTEGGRERRERNRDRERTRETERERERQIENERDRETDLHIER